MNWIRNLLNSEGMLPPFWSKYEDHFKKPINKNAHLEDIRFTVLDTETTGLDTKNDVLVSIAALKVKWPNIIVKDSLEILVNQSYWKGNESIAVHEILPKSLEKGDFDMDAMSAFLDFVKNDVIVAHHAAFDMAMMNKTLKATIGKSLLNKSLDTVALAQRLESNGLTASDASNDKFTLDALAEKYQIDTHDRHTAAGDTMITAQLLLKLLDRLRKRGVDTYENLLRST